MSSASEPVSRPRLLVGGVMLLLVAPIAVQGLVRLLSSWTGEPHAALPVTLATLLAVALAWAVALVRAAVHPRVAWLAAGLAGGLLLFATGAPLSSLATAAIAGGLTAVGLPLAAARAPLPRGRVTAALWGLLAALALLQFGRMSVFMADPQQRWGALAEAEFLSRHSCLTSYVHGAELARRGDANIYDDRYGFEPETRAAELPAAIDIGPLTMDTYEYPPQFLALPRVMLALTDEFMAIRALWFTLTTAVFIAVSLVLARWLGGEAERRARLLLVAVGLSPPLLITAYFGNFQPMAMGLSALAMLWIVQGHTRRGAALLAFTISAKIFPGILGVWLLASRRFAAAAWTALFAVGYAALALLLFGTRPFDDFLGYHLPRLASGETFAFLSQPRPSMSNLGVFGIPFKARLAGWSGSEADAWALARQLAWVYTLGLFVVALVSGWRRPTPTTPHGRAVMLGEWFGLLALGALRSPFAPPEALIPIVWALAFRAAAARHRREVAWIVAAWVAIMIAIPSPSQPAAVVALVVQAVVYTAALWLVLAGRRSA
ncbi:glycosyltransferase family 87 protein [Nannocystis sp. ILAH1]|uniref:glycosyltransferase family 87 protein n=1 Tax=Nannocystis sp. ILAH1 TaxID=2996789 RepID=UPI0022720C62|nr:glycosyltransferase family 87 protein [Nannocystis sp. ILAH1]MCY0992839.1 glycosyltransferase family 87 protein [Nannocystis sp. ILAH1]